MSHTYKPRTRPICAPIFAAELSDIRERIARAKVLTGERITRAVSEMNNPRSQNHGMLDEERELHEQVLVDAEAMLGEVKRMRAGLDAARLAVRSAMEQTPEGKELDVLYGALERAEHCTNTALLDEPGIRAMVARRGLSPRRVLIDEIVDIKRAAREEPTDTSPETPSK